MVVALSLWGCWAGDAVQPCRTGFTREPDGHCYPPEAADTAAPPGFEDALANLPPCLPNAADGAIDLVRGCASGACVGATEPEMSAALNATPSCWNVGWSATRVYCAWPIGVEGLFDDLDQDGFADPDAPNDRVHLYPDYPGGTADGLGVAVRTRCFLDALGTPDWMVLRDIGGDLMIQDIGWDRYGLTAYDWGSDDGSNVPNGHLDNLYLFGAP